jgi:ATP-dependent DNA ligase
MGVCLQGSKDSWILAGKILPIPRVQVHGELVAFDQTGHLSFNSLQNADAETNVVFFAFDVLTYRWRDTKSLPLRERLSLLKNVIALSERVQLSEHFAGPVSKFVAAVRHMGGEGVVDLSSKER